MFLYFTYDEKSSSKLNQFIYYTILCYIISFYIKDIPAITNALTLLLFTIVWFSKTARKNFFNFSKNKINFGIILFFVIQIASWLYSEDKATGFDILQRRLPLLILPLAFCLIDFNEKTWRKILIFFAFLTSFASLLGFAFGIYNTLKYHDTGYLYNDNISTFLFGIQAVYFAFYVNIAVIIFLYLLIYKSDDFRKLKGTMIFSIIWLLFINFMLASKMAMVSLLIIILLMTFKYILSNKKYFEGIIIIMSLFIALFIVNKLSPKTFNRFKGITHTSFQFDNTKAENHFNADFDESKWNSTNTRIAIWQCGLDIFKANFIFGTGLGDRDKALQNEYSKKQFVYAIETEKNTHNQFLDIAVSMGIIGVMVFIFVFFVYPIKVFFQQKQSFAIFVFMCLALCLLTENMFNRYEGQIFISFILPLSAKIFDSRKIID